MTTLTEINGIGPALAKRLEAAGIVDCATLAAADPSALIGLPGVTEARLAVWQKAAADLAAAPPADTLPVPERQTEPASLAVTDATATLPEPEALADADQPAQEKAKKIKAKDKPKAKKKKNAVASKSAKDGDLSAPDTETPEKKKAKKAKKRARSRHIRQKEEKDVRQEEI